MNDYSELIETATKHVRGRYKERPADTRRLLASAATAKTDSLAPEHQRQALAELEVHLSSL